jgi:hypothetical protein
MPAAYICAIELRRQRQAEAVAQPRIETADELMLARFLFARATSEARTGLEDGR